jgi:predicted AlkP superfamily phosphohydrolase/phosphomutase
VGSKLIWLLWDAASAELAERFLSEGALPNLARLAARGARAAARPAWPCAQTPPGMATLLTGAPTHVHGIYGFREAARPRSSRSAVETETGFDARRLRAEPIWITASRNGLTSTLAFVPLANPYSAYTKGGPWEVRGAEVLAFDAYGAVLAGQAVHRSSDLERASDAFRLVVPFSANAPTLEIRAQGGRVTARAPGGQSVELPLGEHRSLALGERIGVTLLLLESTGTDFALWRSGVWRLDASRPEAAQALFRRAGPFLGSGAGHAAREGLLGKTWREGGTGEAEARFLASLRASSGFFTRASAHVLEAHPAPVTVLYEPCIDETAHLVQDGVDRSDERALGLMREAYRLADAHLGAVLERAGDAVVAIGSDHGQEGVARVFRPNVALRAAGLLATGEAGEIDLGRTRALYGPAANGFVLVNVEGSPRGIVPRSEVADVARRVATLLLEARDEHGSFLLAAHPANEVTPRGRVPGEDAGDLLLVASPGVALSTNADAPLTEPGHGGQHTTSLDKPGLDALFVVAGPGVPRLGRLAERIENLDVAPTLARLVGLPPPRDATGRDVFT